MFLLICWMVSICLVLLLVGVVVVVVARLLFDVDVRPLFYPSRLHWFHPTWGSRGRALELCFRRRTRPLPLLGARWKAVDHFHYCPTHLLLIRYLFFFLFLSPFFFGSYISSFSFRPVVVFYHLFLFARVLFVFFFLGRYWRISISPFLYSFLFLIFQPSSFEPLGLMKLTKASPSSWSARAPTLYPMSPLSSTFFACLGWRKWSTAFLFDSQIVSVVS